jgi:hypothetical protein
MKTVASAIALASAVSVVMPLAAPQSPVAQGVRKPRTVVITESDYAKTIRLRKGDFIEVRLLRGGTSYWVRPEPNPFLRRVYDIPTFQSVPDIGNQNSTHELTINVSQFEIVGECDDPITLKMMYCNARSSEDVRAKREPEDPTDRAFWTRQRIARKKTTRQKFRLGLSPSELKEGMVYKVKLQTTDTQPESKQARAPKLSFAGLDPIAPSPVRLREIEFGASGPTKQATAT